MSRYDEYQDADDAEIARFERWKKEEAARTSGDVIDYDSPDPRDLAHAAAQRVIAEGGTEEQGLAMSFATIVDAARKGDKRVRLDLQDAADR